MNPLAKSSATPIIDPSAHEGNTLQAFNDFIESWEMWYDVASLVELKEDASNAQISEHKAKVFRMCVFAGERLKSDLKAEYNQDLTKLKGDDFNAMVAKLRQRYQPSQNQVLLHYQFHNLQQATGEKIDSFINRVCQHAEKCEFKCKNTSCTSRNAIHEILIRDQIVIGTNNTTIREQALEKELTLTDLISHSRKVEATEEATKVMDSEAPTSPFQVNSICDEPAPPTPISKIGKKGGKYSQKAQRRDNLYESLKSSLTPKRILCCAGCGRTNCDRGQTCAVKNAFCNSCGKRGHFSTVCLKTSKSISTLGSHNSTLPAKVQMMSSSHKQTGIVIANTKTQALIDTGAEVNILLESKVPHHIKKIFQTSITLQPYGSKIITPKGQVTMDTKWGTSTTRATWVVVADKDLQGHACNSISCQLAEDLKIISFNKHSNELYTLSSKQNQHHTANNDFEQLKTQVEPSVAYILSKYEEVFTGLGKMNADPVHFHLKCNAKPVIQPQRHIPYHLQLRFEEIIKEMENDDVIEQRHGLVSWLANPVLVPKPDGNMRVTVDLRGLNRALLNPHLPISRLEDIMPIFNGKSVYSKLDLKTAFHQLELDQESRPLTVFRAGDRLMHYKRLAMGMLPASGELNQRLRPVLARIPNATIIQDDIVIATNDLISHNTILDLVLAALAHAGLTVNPKKMHRGFF